jgi:DNA repair exonuclease SbcCD nuclease subunit
MIYATGDTHIPIDVDKLDDFDEETKDLNLTRDDYLIILGDFGLIWNNVSNYTETKWLNRLNKKRYTILFVDGNHENHPRINSYPEELWNGGLVNKISDNIYHLKRAQIFTLQGLKFFTFGGAMSTDKYNRTEGLSWWPEEVANKKEMDLAYTNLEKHDFEIDYVLTHTCPSTIVKKIGYMERVNDPMSVFFEDLDQYISYRRWLFGHFHITMYEGRFICLFDNFLKLK